MNETFQICDEGLDPVALMNPNLADLTVLMMKGILLRQCVPVTFSNSGVFSGKLVPKPENCIAFAFSLPILLFSYLCYLLKNNSISK